MNYSELLLIGTLAVLIKFSNFHFLPFFIRFDPGYWDPCTEYQAFSLAVRIGSPPHPQVSAALPPPFRSKVGDTLAGESLRIMDPDFK